MRNVRTKVYKFNELSEAAKQTAIRNFSNINVDFGWWESAYMDAENVGLKITSFGLDRNRHAKGNFIISATDTAQRILKEHGETCETYNTASLFLNLTQQIENDYAGGTDEDEYNIESETEAAEDEFLNSILEDYSIILEKESEYLQSDQAIIETIEANQYEFLKDGSTY
jgi:hypothetical protein